VLGGTGHVGQAVLAELAAAEVATTFTYLSAVERAQALARQHGQRAIRVDLRDRAALGSVVTGLCAESPPDLLVHCAAVGPRQRLAEIDDDGFTDLLGVNLRAPFLACQLLAPHLGARGGGDVVLVAALDGILPVPGPVHFAASQAALLGMTRALAKELGPQGIRVNLVVLGLLDGGLSSALPDSLRRSYLRFSALGRVGTAAEAARTIVWLALENEYMTGALVGATGGV
jgi:NAD(P)-dependent dehydrogenase (short-subunit alcohol dehydrogenase family)